MYNVHVSHFFSIPSCPGCYAHSPDHVRLFLGASCGVQREIVPSPLRWTLRLCHFSLWIVLCSRTLVHYWTHPLDKERTPRKTYILISLEFQKCSSSVDGDLCTSRAVFASEELAEMKTFSNNMMKFRFWHLFSSIFFRWLMLSTNCSPK